MTEKSPDAAPAVTGMTRVKLGISACLLGEAVRYDGGHKLDSFLRDTLGRHVEYVPVCPEVECGLGVPREAMQLRSDPTSPRLVTIGTGVDHTDLMTDWATHRLDELALENLAGYIFKSRSPSCGMECITVHDDCGEVISDAGVGIWARMFRERFPDLPIEDETSFSDRPFGAY